MVGSNVTPILRCLVLLGLAMGCLGTAGLQGGPAPDDRPTVSSSTVPNTAAPSGQKPRAEVFIVQDAAATTHFVPDTATVRRMVERGLMALTGKSSSADAWRSVIRTNDTVGFKVTSGPGEISGTRPVVVRALIETLIDAGHRPQRIVIWDKRGIDLRAAGWFELASRMGVRCEASEDAGWDPDPTRAYEKAVIGRLVAGDVDFPRKDDLNAGRRSYVSRLLTRDLSVVIPVTPVLIHNLAGVNGQLFNLAAGSVDNTLRFLNNANLIAEAVPEICALDDLLPRVVFGVSDALVCQYRGEETVRLHNTVVLNELRFSRDSVALDALALDDVQRARANTIYAPDKSFETDLYVNAELLELGVSDFKRIDIRRPN